MDNDVRRLILENITLPAGDSLDLRPLPSFPSGPGSRMYFNELVFIRVTHSDNGLPQSDAVKPPPWPVSVPPASGQSGDATHSPDAPDLGQCGDPREGLIFRLH